jgi:hypothetical protein
MAVGTPHLTTLPPEILLIITERFHEKDLVRLSRTCRRLSHFGDYKSVAKGFTRYGNAEDAIYVVLDDVYRMALVAELFRHVEDRDEVYPVVAELAARLNDVEQLESWRTEFGFIPTDALIGAVRSDRIETFDYALAHVALDNELAERVFGTIGNVGNRAMYDHFRSKHSAWVTPKCIEKVVESSALSGRLDFALNVYDSLPHRSGQVLIKCAGLITVGAAVEGNSAIFTEFVNMFEYEDLIRNAIANASAMYGRDELMRIQEESMNSAYSFSTALEHAVEKNHLAVVQLILGDDRFIDYRLDGQVLADAHRLAIKLKRTEMLPLIFARVPRRAVLDYAAKSESLDKAKSILASLGVSDKVRVDDNVDGKVDFGAYSDDVPDWKMMVWLIVIGLDSNTRFAKSNIDDDELARYRSLLPAAVDLARELNVPEGDISSITRFAHGCIEYSSDDYY